MPGLSHKSTPMPIRVEATCELQSIDNVLSHRINISIRLAVSIVSNVVCFAYCTAKGSETLHEFTRLQEDTETLNMHDEEIEKMVTTT